MRSQKLKVKEFGKGKGKINAEDAEFAEKRDGNTEFAEGRTQRSRRKTEKRERVFTTEDTESTE